MPIADILDSDHSNAALTLGNFDKFDNGLREALDQVESLYSVISRSYGRRADSVAEDEEDTEVSRDSIWGRRTRALLLLLIARHYMYGATDLLRLKDI